MRRRNKPPISQINADLICVIGVNLRLKIYLDVFVSDFSL